MAVSNASDVASAAAEPYQIKIGVKAPVNFQTGMSASLPALQNFLQVHLPASANFKKAKPRDGFELLSQIWSEAENLNLTTLTMTNLLTGLGHGRTAAHSFQIFLLKINVDHKWFSGELRVSCKENSPTPAMADLLEKYFSIYMSNKAWPHNEHKSWSLGELKSWAQKYQAQLDLTSMTSDEGVFLDYLVK